MRAPGGCEQQAQSQWSFAGFRPGDDGLLGTNKALSAIFASYSYSIVAEVLQLVSIGFVVVEI